MNWLICFLTMKWMRRSLPVCLLLLFITVLLIYLFYFLPEITLSGQPSLQQLCQTAKKQSPWGPKTLPGNECHFRIKKKKNTMRLRENTMCWATPFYTEHFLNGHLIHGRNGHTEVSFVDLQTAPLLLPVVVICVMWVCEFGSFHLSILLKRGS